MMAKTISVYFAGHACNDSMKNAVRSLLDERNIPSETEEINVTVNKYSDEYMFVVNFLSNKISIQALRYKSHVIMTARGSDWKPVENMGQFTDPSGKFFKIVLPAQPTRF